ncbi:hypothetical protein ANN_27011 [Periplaneta americana]|uniref:Uncharacterized protein n=1 Tax=Periplaneta americana TaxID=6978 RepID=A0ABQ8RX27_PERAM|nr:hypothetical protein ANN_27011 [Periplaneta americana]
MIKDLSGNMINEQEQILDRWRSHFQLLLNNERGDEEILGEIEEDFNEGGIEGELEEPDRIDIRMAIEALKMARHQALIISQQN